MNKVRFIRGIIFSSILLLSACSNVPVAIRTAPDKPINLIEANNNSQTNQGRNVRWGGTIVKVENQKNITRMQVLYYPLNSQGRPKLDSPAQGRFMIHSAEFLDPAIYVKGTEFTVTGILDGTTEEKIGEKTLSLPVVNFNAGYLWPQYKQRNYRYDRYPPYYYGFYPYPIYGYRYPYRYNACY